RPRLIKYPPEKAQQFLRTVMERLQLAPGVESASMVGGGAVLLGGSGKVSLPEWPDTQALQCGQIEIGPRYFETLQTPVLRGCEGRSAGHASSVGPRGEPGRPRRPDRRNHHTAVANGGEHQVTSDHRKLCLLRCGIGHCAERPRSLRRVGIRRVPPHERDWYPYGSRGQIGDGASRSEEHTSEL